jgi:hypothetical protein
VGKTERKEVGIELQRDIHTISGWIIQLEILDEKIKQEI